MNNCQNGNTSYMKFVDHAKLSVEAHERASRERDEALEQRDTLADAMRQMWPFIEEDNYPNCNTPAFSSAIEKYQAALAAVKGEKP